MQKIIEMLTRKYALTRAEIMSEVENVFSSYLSRWHQIEVLVFFSKDWQLEAVAYDNNDGMRQRNINLTAIRGKNSLMRQLERNLAKAVVLKQTRQYKYYERELRWGEISAIDGTKNWGFPKSCG